METYLSLIVLFFAIYLTVLLSLSTLWGSPESRRLILEMDICGTQTCRIVIVAMVLSILMKSFHLSLILMALLCVCLCYNLYRRAQLT